METQKINTLYKKSRTHRRFIILAEKISIALIWISVVLIVLSFIVSSRSVVKSVGGAEAKGDSLDTQKKFMIRPRLEVEDIDAFYNINAERGYYETEDKIVFENADFDSNLGTLKADEIIIENDFNNITIQENPELVIYPDSI